jgi:hypothetical protein
MDPKNFENHIGPKKLYVSCILDTHATHYKSAVEASSFVWNYDLLHLLKAWLKYKKDLGLWWNQMKQLKLKQ